MIKNFKIFALGFISASVIFCGLVYASQISETVQRTFKDIKIVINGNTITPKDANGNIVEPFIINGTTFLPVRAVGEALGLTVAWDGNTNTVTLGNGTTSVETPSTTTSTQATVNLPKSGTLKIGQTFEFDDLEITIGSNISFDKINNQFSEYNKQDVIKIPVTVKNIKDESHSLNMFYYKGFGSTGTQAKDLSTYFDDSIFRAGSLRTGASHTCYIYLLYDGDGQYALEFDDWSNKVTVEFNVSK